MRAKTNATGAPEATWDALATYVQSLPDLMDRGLGGSAYTSTGLSARAYSGSNETPEGVYLYAEFIGWHIITAEMDSMMLFLTDAIASSSTNSSSIEITWSGAENFSSFTDWYQSAKPTPSEVAQIPLMSSRLLGRDQLSKSQSEVKSYLQRVMASKIPAAGALLILGLQGGPGPANVPQEMRAALNPVWREAHLHAIFTGASVNTMLAPEAALQEAATWVKQNKEAVWREWAPTTGAYMNEANPYNTHWKHDYYGVNYRRLRLIKQKYDPAESLFVLTGVNSDAWSHDLNSERLCRTDPKVCLYFNHPSTSFTAT